MRDLIKSAENLMLGINNKAEESKVAKVESLKEDKSVVPEVSSNDEVTVIYENAFEIEIPAKFEYSDYVKAALVNNGYECLSDISEDSIADVIKAIDTAYKDENEDFVIESLGWSEMQDKIAAHKKAGHKVTDVTSGTRAGKPYAAYTVIDREGMKRRHIYHGSTRKIENIGQTSKPGDKETDE